MIPSAIWLAAVASFTFALCAAYAGAIRLSGFVTLLAALCVVLAAFSDFERIGAGPVDPLLSQWASELQK